MSTNPYKERTKQLKRKAKMRAVEARIRDGINRGKQGNFSTSGCSCRNHMGTKKAEYKTREAALEAILEQHLNYGPGYEVYECPVSDRFHVATKRGR